MELLSGLTSLPQMDFSSQFTPKQVDTAPFVVEFDSKRGVIEFLSKKKTARKVIERAFSIKATSPSGPRFHLVEALYEGDEISDVWLCDQINLILQQDKDVEVFSMESNKENSKIQMHEVTPEESPTAAASHKRNLVPESTFDPSILRNLSINTVAKFIDIFFSCNLNDSTVNAATFNLSSAQKKSPLIPILISIEGNIGAGKSFLLAQLRKSHPEWCFIDEPLDFWESLRTEKGESLLEIFYKDQRRWSYTFQNCALLSRYQNIESCIKNIEEKEAIHYSQTMNKPLCKVFITERCLSTDHEVFAKMLYADGQLDKLEYDLYTRWFGLLGKTATPLSAIIYVDTEPGLCSNRISKRGRDGEEGIPLAYLKSLDTFQAKWINSTEVPVARTTSDTIEIVEAFVDGLIKKHTSSAL